MKILYVLNSSKYGGMEWHVYDLVKGMVKNGHDVYVWCPQGEIAEIIKSVGGKVTYESISKDIDKEYIKRLSKFINDNSIEVVHSHELKASCNMLLACRNTNVKVKITHTHTPISEWRIGSIKKFIDKKLYSYLVNKYSSVEISLTQSKKDTKIKEGIKEGNLVVIPNGLDTSKFDITPNQRSSYEEEIKNKYGIPKTAFVFGNIGRISKEKGHKVMIKAFLKFLESDLFHKTDFFLLIAGGGPMEEEVKMLVKESGLDGKVIITGEFSEVEKVKYYSAFDAFLFPTYAEGFGIVLVEALYMGLPTICSDLEVLKEVGNEEAVYFEVGNVVDLAKKMISEYNKTGGDGKIVSDKAKAYVEKTFSMDKFINNYQDLYTRLLEETR